MSSESISLKRGHAHFSGRAQKRLRTALHPPRPREVIVPELLGVQLFDVQLQEINFVGTQEGKHHQASTQTLLLLKHHHEVTHRITKTAQCFCPPGYDIHKRVCIDRTHNGC